MYASRFRMRVVAVLLVAYLGFVCLVTLTPTPVDSPYQVYIAKALAKLHAHGLPVWFGYNHVEFSANVAMFVPIGFLAALLLPRKAWWVLIFLGSFISGAIELAQQAFLPARFAEPRDVLANSLGALVGAVIAIALRLLVMHRDRLVALDNAGGVGGPGYSVDDTVSASAAQGRARGESVRSSRERSNRGRRVT